MPAKNRIKEYQANSYYHIYNRGVEKRIIFLDEQDENVFLNYLKEYLLPKDEKFIESLYSSPNSTPPDKDRALKLLRLNNFFEEITILAYCLMPNHFHFLIKQKSADSIDKFMNSIATRYTMYFNKKYKRVGPLFQGVYKAVLVNTNEQLLHLSRYIHKQAIDTGIKLSSYENYLGVKENPWIHPSEILSFFSPTSDCLSYKEFVEGNTDSTFITTLTLE